MDGLTVNGLYATIRGLVVNRFSRTGIAIRYGYGHRVAGCFVGTDPLGAVARANQYGVVIEIVPVAANKASANLPSLAVIGGLDVSDRNLISGNFFNGLIVGLGTSNCVIQNNYIGTDAYGQAALPNQTGLTLLSVLTSVGGCASPCAGQLFPGANVISGNTGSGIDLGFIGPNFISGNRIGTDASGTKPLPNRIGISLIQTTEQFISWNVISGNTNSGIRIFHSDGTSISGNLIGTNIQGAAPLPNGGSGVEIVGTSSHHFVGSNTIAYNGKAGISIGLDLSDGSNDNLISANSIHDNGGLGIDLGSDGATPNNDCDTGRGPNLLQNAPVLTSAVPSLDTTTVSGTLNSVPNTTFRIEFFSSPLCDPTGFGEGETRVGTQILVTTDGSCNASFEAVLPAALPLGSVVTAIATDPSGNSSEFSACRRVKTGLDFYTITPCRIADTRDPPGPFGGPPLSPETDRLFTVAGRCGIPSDASAVAFNFTVTQPEASGNLQIFPGTTPLPVPPALYYSAGQTRAKNAVLALDAVGRIGTHVTQSAGTVDFVIDATGYFR